MEDEVLFLLGRGGADQIAMVPTGSEAVNAKNTRRDGRSSSLPLSPSLSAANAPLSSSNQL